MIQFLVAWSLCFCYFFGFFAISFIHQDISEPEEKIGVEPSLKDEPPRYVFLLKCWLVCFITCFPKDLTLTLFSIVTPQLVNLKRLCMSRLLVHLFAVILPRSRLQKRLYWIKRLSRISPTKKLSIWYWIINWKTMNWKNGWIRSVPSLFDVWHAMSNWHQWLAKRLFYRTYQNRLH